MENLILNDGSYLSLDDTKILAPYLKSSSNNFFDFINGTWQVSCVGFLSISVKEKKYNIYCLPKHYKIDPLEVESHMRKLIRVFKKVNRKNNGFFDKKSLYGNLLFRYARIEEYYKTFGIYETTHQRHEKKIMGNINWEKTIIKSKTLHSNNNDVYDKFVVNKKERKEDFISECMKLALNKAHEYFPFYFKKYDFTVKKYMKKISLNVCLNILVTEKKNIFGDRNILLVKDMIYILENKLNDFNKGAELLTREFSHIWEEIVASLCDETFEHKKRFTIDKSGKYIELDHFSKKNKVILDSKYYLNNTINSGNEYKQLFYNYHMLSKYGNKFTNVLVKASDYEEDIIVNIDREYYDNMSLYDIKIPIKKAINLYLEGKNYDYIHIIDEHMINKENNN